MRRSNLICLVIALAVAAGNLPSAAVLSQTAPSQRTAIRPKLVVVLVVDQFRADYVEHYGRHWTGGLRRLMSEGAWFRAAAYRHMAAMTCVGHSNIVTGAYPATHGVVSNAWWDRAGAKAVPCEADPNEKLLRYSPRAAAAGGAGGGSGIAGPHGVTGTGTQSTAGTSARNLMAPALPDEMRLQLPVAPRVVTLSLKDYTATMLAGRHADAATWFDAATHSWATSTAFAKAPVPFLQAYLAANPLERSLDEVWRKLLPEAAYLHEEDGAGEKGAAQWTTKFPHPLKSKSGTADAEFYDAWQSSPFSDAYLADMAKAAVDALKLGQGRGTDYLAISFSALDLVGHDFGPRSHEVQDLLARLDRTLGDLLAHLDGRVGAGRYVVALTADHGVAPIPEQARASGLGGRLSSADLTARISKALEPFVGAGSHVARLSYADLHFQPAVWEKIRDNPEAVQAAIDAARSMPGIARVLRADQVPDLKRSPDRIERAAALNYFPGRSGHLLVVAQPYYFFSSGTTGTSHGTPYAYDQRVPIFLMGPGIRRGQYLTDVGPVDIAPTLAWLCGVTMAGAEGRVLTEAIK